MVATSFTKFKSHKFQFPPEPGRQAGRIPDRSLLTGTENIEYNHWKMGAWVVGWGWGLGGVDEVDHFIQRKELHVGGEIGGIRRTLTDPHYLLCCGQAARLVAGTSFPSETWPDPDIRIL